MRSAYGSDQATDYRYTGQRSEGEIGLDFYVSRFYDPALGRFVQPDSIIPDPGSSKGFDRYAYVNNNPINFNDPSGHGPCDGLNRPDSCDATEWKDTADYWIWMIKAKPGVTLAEAGSGKYITWEHDDGTKEQVWVDPRAWGITNAKTVFYGLEHATKTARGAHSNADTYYLWTGHDGHYLGWTSNGRLDFYNSDNVILQNFYHEYGHSIDYSDRFTHQLEQISTPSWINNGIVVDGVLYSDAAFDLNVNNAEVIQASGPGTGEQWADMFANLANNNINLSANSPGLSMYQLMLRALASKSFSVR